ncbi:MAG: hypothetical protein ISR65_19225 [Bacteriovoracaceae bacterium]|nr:hypothetical protein [Bacteriovoracaceae bacterium]
MQQEVSSATQAIFDQGQQVGNLARQYFSGGVEVAALAYELDKAEVRTQKFIDDGKGVIYEAFAFSQDGVYSRIDILRKVRGKEQWDMIEVKSSTSVKDQFIDDICAKNSLSDPNLHLKMKNIKKWGILGVI